MPIMVNFFMREWTYGSISLTKLCKNCPSILPLGAKQSYRQTTKLWQFWEL